MTWIFRNGLPGPAKKRMRAAMVASFPIRSVRMSAIKLRRTSLAASGWFRHAHVELLCLTVTRPAGGDLASEGTLSDYEV